MASLPFCLHCTLLLLLLLLICLFRALLLLLSLLLCLFSGLLRLIRALLHCTQERFECFYGPWILHLKITQIHCGYLGECCVIELFIEREASLVDRSVGRI
jgi:hypothetical protein